MSRSECRALVHLASQTPQREYARCSCTRQDDQHKPLLRACLLPFAVSGPQELSGSLGCKIKLYEDFYQASMPRSVLLAGGGRERCEEAAPQPEDGEERRGIVHLQLPSCEARKDISWRATEPVRAWWLGSILLAQRCWWCEEVAPQPENREERRGNVDDICEEIEHDESLCWNVVPVRRMVNGDAVRRGRCE